MSTDFIQSLAKGDMSAYRKLYGLYWGRVRAFALKLTGEEWIADEIAQNVFIRIWTVRQRLEIRTGGDNRSDSMSPLAGFIFTIAKNEVMDWFRMSAKVRKFQESFVLELSDEISMHDNIDTENIIKIIHAVVNTMPLVRRDVFVSSRYLDMTNQEIADKLNISKRTVEKHLNLALKQLRSALVAYLK